MSYEKDIELRELKEKEQKKIDDRAKRLKIAYQEILNSNSGRMVLKSILDLAPIDFDAFNSDSNLMAYNCGKLSVIKELRNYIKINFKNDTLNNVENTEI